MKVCEFFSDAQMDVIEEKAVDSEYWQNVYDFLENNAQKEIDDLTGRQFDWLYKIQNQLEGE